MLLILLTIVFTVLRIVPGDPIAALFAGRASPDIVAATRHRLGLDLPIWQQYVNYVVQVFTGNLGTSIGASYHGKSVLFIIMDKLPATIELTVGAMIIASIVGISTGVVSGTRRDKRSDIALRLYGTIIFVVPIFWLGQILQLIFAVDLRLFPAQLRFSGGPPPGTITGLYTLDSLLEGNLGSFLVSIWHLVLPSLTLGLVLSGFFTKTVRANLLRTVKADYVEAARARGIPENKIVSRYAFRNALIPVITVLGLQFAILFAGAVLTERTFTWDGMGTLLLTAINEADYPMVEGVIVVYALIIVLVSLVIDVINGLIDPRVRY
jgi:peptide/nickel transport system permease protein